MILPGNIVLFNIFTVELILLDVEAKLAHRVIVHEIQPLWTLEYKRLMLLRLCIAAVVCFLIALSLLVFLRDFDFVLQETPSVKSSACLIFLGNFLRLLLIFDSRFTVLSLAFLVAALLLLNI